MIHNRDSGVFTGIPVCLCQVAAEMRAMLVRALSSPITLKPLLQGLKGDELLVKKVQHTGALILMLLGMLISAPVWPATGGGATIHSVATVTYNGVTETASVDVTVLTFASSPTITVNTLAQTVTPGATASYFYVIVNNANGADSFTINASSTDVGVVAAPALNVAGSGTASTVVNLGASISNAPSVVNTVFIPAGSETALTAGDVFVIAGLGRYTINVVTAGTAETTVGNVTTPETPTALTLTPLVSAPAIAVGTVAAGMQMGEEYIFTIDVTASTPSVSGVDGTHTVNFSVTTTANGAGGIPLVYNTSAGDNNETVTTVRDNIIQLVKEVRNVTTGSAFASTGIRLQSGDVLEYRMTVTAVSGGGDVLNNILTDEVPVYTAYVPGSTTLNGVAVADGTGASLPLTAANSGLVINSSSGTAGVVVGGESAVVLFQVTVD
ncbi:MAG: hypothetical protein BMS9Abin36_1562 [Gammaproteobacteria bacterium]|nr:MAG: hypothetical protein BMS9Abin36_1562 [Gammaproteobacteria bacterium]